jgi:hypothetical protein
LADNLKGFEDLTVPELEKLSFSFLQFCASDDALNHPDLPQWIAAGIEAAQRIRDLGIERESSKVLQLSQIHLLEWQGVHRWYLAEMQARKQQSGLQATSGIYLPETYSK